MLNVMALHVVVGLFACPFNACGVVRRCSYACVCAVCLLPWVVCHQVDNKRVVVAGLDGDFKRDKFNMVELIELASNVRKLHSNCSVCGASAPFTARKSQRQEVELVGGAEQL